MSLISKAEHLVKHIEENAPHYAEKVPQTWGHLKDAAEDLKAAYEDFKEGAKDALAAYEDLKGAFDKLGL